MFGPWVLILPVWLFIGFFLARFCFKVFMGPLLEKGRGKPGRMQYTMGDLYFLILQIAVAVLPVSLSAESDRERAAWMLGIALYLSITWALCCWLLSRVHVHNRKARRAAMLAFPFELACVLFVWVYWPILLFISPLLLPLLLFLHGFASLSDWVFSKREEPKRESAVAAKTLVAIPKALPKNDAERIEP